MAEIRMTPQTLRVLAALCEAHRDELSGAEIGRSTKLATGTLYPILMRLERAGWVQSRWEDGDPSDLGRPRKRFYKITGLGIRNAKAAHRELEPTFRRLSWI